MSSPYKDLLILRLSGTAEWLNEKEMVVPKDMVNWEGHSYTCEFLGSGRCILRGYHIDGSKCWKEGHLNGQIQWSSHGYMDRE